MNQSIQSCKLVFTDFAKIVQMNIPRKLVLDDLKITLTKILGISLFAKKLVFCIRDRTIDSSRSLDDQGEDFLNCGPGQLQITIKIEELGA